jgi:hypothetical protein
MNATQTTRSIAAGSDPAVQTLIGEWTAAGFMVESSHDGDRWWHRRIAPEYIKDLNLPTNLMTAYATVISSSEHAPEMIGQWLADGNMVTSRLFGSGWFNQAAKVGDR